MTRILAFDTETTDLIPKGVRSFDDPEYLNKCPYITQISYVIYDTDKQTIQMSNYYIHLTENVKINPIAANITKIYKTKTDVIQCCNEGVEDIHILTDMIYPKIKTIEECLDEFLNEFYICDIVTSHNTDFDKTMLLIELSRMNRIQDRENVRLYKDKFVCTMLHTKDICKIVLPNRNIYKFPKLTEAYEILLNVKINDITKLHNSLIDSLMCLRIYCYMNKTEIRDIYNINPTIHYILESLTLRRSSRIYKKIINSI
jgi:DNA polymerase III epsilon subunit-like protein